MKALDLSIDIPPQQIIITVQRGIECTAANPEEHCPLVRIRFLYPKVNA